jgi:hypothetical protein
MFGLRAKNRKKDVLPKSGQKKAMARKRKEADERAAQDEKSARKLRGVRRGRSAYV